jgi:hypothetical protein
MSFQLYLVIPIIGLATAYLTLRAWRTWTHRTGCAGGCHCDSKPAQKPSITIVARDSLGLRGESARNT